MIGLSIPQFVEVTEFIQKHHPFGYVREENQLPKIPHGYCIKYIDSTYDTRDGSYWHLKFRGFGETILNANFTPKITEQQWIFYITFAPYRQKNRSKTHSQNHSNHK